MPICIDACLLFSRASLLRGRGTCPSTRLRCVRKCRTWHKTTTIPTPCLTYISLCESAVAEGRELVVDVLDVGHRSVVALAKSTAENTCIPSRSWLVPRGKLTKHLVGERRILGRLCVNLWMCTLTCSYCMIPKNNVLKYVCFVAIFSGLTWQHDRFYH